MSEGLNSGTVSPLKSSFAQTVTYELDISNRRCFGAASEDTGGKDLPGHIRKWKDENIQSVAQLGGRHGLQESPGLWKVVDCLPEFSFTVSIYKKHSSNKVSLCFYMYCPLGILSGFVVHGLFSPCIYFRWLQSIHYYQKIRNLILEEVGKGWHTVSSVATALRSFAPSVTQAHKVVSYSRRLLYA